MNIGNKNRKIDRINYKIGITISNIKSWRKHKCKSGKSKVTDIKRINVE